MKQKDEKKTVCTVKTYRGENVNIVTNNNILVFTREVCSHTF